MGLLSVISVPKYPQTTKAEPIQGQQPATKSLSTSVSKRTELAGSSSQSSHHLNPGTPGKSTKQQLNQPLSETLTLRLPC